MCGFKPVAAKTPCTHDGGKLCDGAGHCVACVTDAQCATSSPDPCNGGVYTAPPMCKSGMCESVKEDCGAKGQVCTPTGCAPSCTTNADCGAPLGGCVDKKCNAAGLCEKVPLLQGKECLPPEIGTCGATGACLLPRKYVFVTSAPFPANFGGTATADAKCNSLASTAMLGGTWKSWTSDGGASPLATPLGRFTHSLVPYVLLDDVSVVASNWMGLTSMPLMHGIKIDEKKQQLLFPIEVWTGTNTDGSYANNSCTNWTFNGVDGVSGTFGVSGEVASGWTNMKQQACNLMARLYCFQQ